MYISLYMYSTSIYLSIYLYNDALLCPAKAGAAGVETVSMGGCVSSSVGWVFSETVAPVEYE